MPALRAKLVDVTKGFGSVIELKYLEQQVDAKSIMSLLMLGAAVGSELTIKVTGPDENDAFEAVCELINAGFHELDD